MSVRIIECTDPAQLYRRYSGETEPQPAYIELDLREGTLLADYDSEVGGAIPFTVYHGFERRYGIPILTADAANQAMEKIAPIAERILADWEEEWDGNNMVARLGEDAQAAEEELEQALGLPTEHSGSSDAFDDSDLVSVWDIDGATNGCEVNDYGITADTTDARLEEIEQEILADLRSVSQSSVVVCDELLDYLKGLRDELAEEDPLTSAELRAAREYHLGLTGEALAKKLGVNPRTVRSWEGGRDPIPGRVRLEIAELKEDTAKVVVRMVAEVKDSEDARLVTYRSDEEYEEAVRDSSWRDRLRGWSAAWHRQVCARVAEQTGARITYAGDEDDE